MPDLAQELSSEDKAYFGDEAVAEATASETGAPVDTETEAKAPVETTAETKPEAKTEEETAQHKTVPLAALHEERERRKELQREIEEQKTRVARIEDRHNQFVAALNRPAPAEQPKSVQEDPIAAVERIDRELSERRQQEAQQGEAQRQYQQLQTYVGEHEIRFRAATPDYNAALEHLTASRTSEYEAMGYRDPAQIGQLVTRDAIGLAVSAAQRGLSPAELVYNLAKQRGYAPKAAETPAAESKPAAPAVSGEDKMAMLEKGTAAAKSLSAGGGGNADLSLESLAGMDDEDFAKISESQWRKLWGAAA